MELENKLKEGFKKFGLEINDKQVEQFMEYMDLLLEYNEKMNLTAITEKEDVIVKHFLDSVSVLTVVKFRKGIKVIDVGTGAGFPSIPLKIMLPEVEFTLVDSLKKRVGFLDVVIDKLGLEHIEAIHGRCEDLGRDEKLRGRFDIGVSRALARMEILGELSIPFIKKGGKFVALKGPKVHEELEKAKRGLKKLGCVNIEVKNIKLPFTEMTHKIAIIDKEHHTPYKYPRHPSKISKNPL